MATNRVTISGTTEPAAIQAERDAGKVLLLGGLAAGAVAGLLVLLVEKEEKPKSRMEQARIAFDDVAGEARKQGDRIGSDLESTLAAFRGDAEKERKKARKKAKKQGKWLRKESGKRAEGAAASLSDLLGQAREEVMDRYKAAEKQAPELESVLDEVRARTEELIKDARESGRQVRKQSDKDARKAKKEMVSLLDVVKSKASDAEKVAESYVESTLIPRLKDFEKEASSAFETGKKISAQKGAELRKQAESDVIPQARESAEQLRDTLEEQAKNVAENWGKGSHDAVELLQDARENVGTRAHDAGEAVKQGSRDTRSLLLWVGIAAALVYWVFLDDEQQQKVKSLSMDLFGEAKEMYSDLKGEDTLSA